MSSQVMGNTKEPLLSSIPCDNFVLERHLSSLKEYSKNIVYLFFWNLCATGGKWTQGLWEQGFAP